MGEDRIATRFSHYFGSSLKLTFGLSTTPLHIRRLAGRRIHIAHIGDACLKLLLQNDQMIKFQKYSTINLCVINKHFVK